MKNGYTVCTCWERNISIDIVSIPGRRRREGTRQAKERKKDVNAETTRGANKHDKPHSITALVLSTFWFSFDSSCWAQKASTSSRPRRKEGEAMEWERQTKEEGKKCRDQWERRIAFTDSIIRTCWAQDASTYVSSSIFLWRLAKWWNEKGRKKVMNAEIKRRASNQTRETIVMIWQFCSLDPIIAPAELRIHRHRLIPNFSLTGSKTRCWYVGSRGCPARNCAHW